MGKIGEPQEPFIWTIVSCAMPSAMNRQMRAEIVWVTTVKKLIKNKVAVLKIRRNSTGNQWSFLKIGLACEYLFQFVTILPSVF